MATTQNNICLFNTLKRRKERFKPIKAGQVYMYTCGPTVYDYAHIGNFRAFLFEDLLKRWLKYRGYKVTHVMNITDVDDKTIKGSQTQHIPLKQYTEFYTKAFFEDAATLSIEAADLYPRATENIPEMVALIKKLLEKGFAYKGEDNSIYYDISKFVDYGKLSKIHVQELKAGARVKNDEYAKEEARDFALWKAYSNEDGEVFWETTLGKGRPGWHIECSAMSMKYLGETFDIHCGGIDNIFPHHENEIAQSEAATGKQFVRYWLHNEHLQVEGKKMAKRFGNFYTLRDLLAKSCNAKAIRYLLLSTQYRQQFNFTFEGLDAAESAIDRLTNFMRRLQDSNGEGSGEKILQLIKRVQACFGEAMDDDLNISVALASLFDFVRDVNIMLDSNELNRAEAQKVYELLEKFDAVLGVVGKVETEKLSIECASMIEKREAARKAKDWKTADAIRQQLRTMGIVLEDTAQGVKWRREKN
jgi:cysteinyl-tRNA synthetase